MKLTKELQQDRERIKKSLKVSLEKARNNKTIKASQNKFNQLIKFAFSEIDSYPYFSESIGEFRGEIKGIIETSLKEAKTKRIIQVGECRLENVIKFISHNIDNPDYVRKAEQEKAQPRTQPRA